MKGENLSIQDKIHICLPYMTFTTMIKSKTWLIEVTEGSIMKSYVELSPLLNFFPNPLTAISIPYPFSGQIEDKAF